MTASVPPQYAQYYGIIASASAERVSAADLWALISAYEEQEGISRPTGLFSAVNTMRSVAVGGRNAGEKLTAAPDSTVIDASMIAQNIDSRPLNEQELAPAFTIRYQATVLTGEGEQTVWRSIIQRGALPLTKGGLVDLVISQFIDDSASYGAIATGLTGNINISAV
jgi:hypothetical protein